MLSHTLPPDVFTVTGPGRHLLKDVSGTIESIAPFLVTGLYPMLKSVAKIVKEGILYYGSGTTQYEYFVVKNTKTTVKRDYD